MKREITTEHTIVYCEMEKKIIVILEKGVEVSTAECNDFFHGTLEEFEVDHKGYTMPENEMI